MKKKKESKMTKPIVLDEKIPKGVDKTLIAGNSIIMTQTTHSYDEFVGASKKAKTTKPNKPKESKQPIKSNKKITFEKTMRDGSKVKDEGYYFKTSNGVEVAIHRVPNSSSKKWTATELSTGKLVLPHNESTAKTIVDAVNQVEKVSPSIKKAIKSGTQQPKGNTSDNTATKNKRAAKSTSTPIKVNIPTDAINLALSEAKIKEIQKSSKKKKVDELVAQGADRKVAKAMVDAAYTCGVAHMLGDTSKSATTSKSAVPNKAEAPKQAQPSVTTVKPTTAKAATTTLEKRRVYKSMPQNYSVVQGTVAQSDGTILIHNGKPLFKQNKDGSTQQAKDSRGKPAHKVAALVVDPKAYNQAKNAERKLVNVEIRKHNDAKGGHPHIMVDTIGDKNVSVGITHSKKKGKNHPNIPLEHNPLGDKKKAYMQRQGTVDNKENYSSKKTTGKLTETDNAKAKQIGAKAKQKHLDKQKAKK